MKLLIYTVNQIAIIGEVDRNAMTLLICRIVIIDEIDKDKNWMHQDYNISAERMYQKKKKGSNRWWFPCCQTI